MTKETKLTISLAALHGEKFICVRAGKCFEYRETCNHAKPHEYIEGTDPTSNGCGETVCSSAEKNAYCIPVEREEGANGG